MNIGTGEVSEDQLGNSLSLVCPQKLVTDVADKVLAVAGFLIGALDAL